MTPLPNPTTITGHTLSPPPVQPLQVQAAAPGDRDLIQAYIAVIQRKVEGHRPGLIKVPTQTVLGQWLELHRSQLEHPIIQGWMREQKIDPSSLSIVPSTGAMSAKVEGVRKDFSLSDGTGWGQVSGPLLASSKVIAPGAGQDLRIRSGEYTVDVSAKVVTGFYGMQLPANLSEGRTQMRQLEHRKSFDAIAPDDQLRPASLRSAQALDIQKANAETFYSAAPQKLAYTHLAVGVANAYPNVREQAKQWAGDLIKQLTGKEVDPDTLYFNRFRSGQSDPGVTTETGYEHRNEEPISSQRLPEALLSNFSEHDQDPGTLDSISGIYTVGTGQKDKGGYGAHNEFRLAPSDLMHASRKTDFQTVMTRKIDTFWNTHGDDYRTALKGEFTQQARQQLKGFEAKKPTEQRLMPDEEKFTPSDYKIVMGAASNLPLDENTPLTVPQLQAQAPASGKVRAYAFDINGWGSSDIIRFAVVDDLQYNYENNRRDGTQILYIPGNKPVFLRFDSLQKMDDWVEQQAKAPKRREALASHFSKYNRQDGGVFSRPGVDSALAHLAKGDWSKVEGETIDRNYVRLEGDIFSHMRDQAKERMVSDADTAIKSNSEVTRDTWLNDISVAAGLFAKMAPVAAPVAGVATGLGITELALGAEKAASGDTQAERSDGAGKAFDGALNTLFSAGASGRVEDPFAMPREKGGPAIPDQNTTIDILNDSRTGRELPNRLQPSQAGNISNFAVAEGERLIENKVPNAKGIYQVKDGNDVDLWLIRHTDDTGVSKVYEIRGDFKLSDNYVQIIDPATRKPVMTVYLDGDGGWVRETMQGGWPWSRPPSPSLSDSIELKPKVSDLFVDSKGAKISGAEKFDDYLNLPLDKDPLTIDSVYQDGATIKRKLTLSWKVDDNEFAVTPGEKATQSPYSTSQYSTSFAPDLNRENYTIIKDEAGVKSRKPLDFRVEDEDVTLNHRFATFEEQVPDPALRARISEVAHQGSSLPALLELSPPVLRDDFSVAAGPKNFTINYNPASNEHTVIAETKWVLKYATEDGMVINRDLDIKSTRTFTIRESNQLDDDGYTIDKSAPTKIEVSTPATV